MLTSTPSSVTPTDYTTSNARWRGRQSLKQMAIIIINFFQIIIFSYAMTTKTFEFYIVLF